MADKIIMKHDIEILEKSMQSHVKALYDRLENLG